MTSEKLRQEITMRKRSEEKFRQLLVIEKALEKVSSLFISTDALDLNKVIKTLGEAVDASRSYICLFHPFFLAFYLISGIARIELYNRCRI